MEVVGFIVIVSAVVALLAALINWIAKKTYASTGLNQVVMFIVLWCTTTLIGAIVYAVLVGHYRNKRGTAPVVVAQSA